MFLQKKNLNPAICLLLALLLDLEKNAISDLPITFQSIASPDQTS